MKENGYSCSSIIGQITQEDIDEVEKYATNELSDLINSLDCCNAETYKRQTEFKFLPGHRKFILRLPIEVAKMKQQTQNGFSSRPIQKRKVVQPTIPNDLINENENEVISVTRPTITNDLIDENEKEVIDEQEQLECLRMELIKKLKQAGKNQKRTWVNVLNLNSVQNLNVESNCNGKIVKGSCRLVCPICSTSYLCNYDKFWQSSNLLKHLNSHGNDLLDVLDDEKENDDQNNGTNFDTAGFGDQLNETDVSFNKSIHLIIDSLESPPTSSTKSLSNKNKVGSKNSKKSCVTKISGKSSVNSATRARKLVDLAFENIN